MSFYNPPVNDTEATISSDDTFKFILFHPPDVLLRRVFCRPSTRNPWKRYLHLCFSLFSVKKNFRNEKIQFSSRRFFFLLVKLPMTRRVQVCKVDVLYNTRVGCHRASEAGGDRFKSRYWPYFSRLSKYSLTRSYFLTAKFRAFSTKK